MELREVVRRRRMVRRFAPDPVEPEVVDRLLEHAVRAPSAGFTQGWAFLVLSADDERERFWTAATPASSQRDMSTWLDGMRTAPVLVVVLASKAAYLGRYAEPDKGWTDAEESRWPVPYWHVDAGMSALLMLQTAVERPAFAAEFGVPAEWEPTGVVAVGHPAEGGAAGSPARRPRKAMDDVVHRGSW
jgi:nitroreductase